MSLPNGVFEIWNRDDGSMVCFGVATNEDDFWVYQNPHDWFKKQTIHKRWELPALRDLLKSQGYSPRGCE